jgi:hypothetical protein
MVLPVAQIEVNQTGEATMKDVNINSKVLLIQMSRFLIQFMELANRIDEEDYKTIVLTAQKMTKPVKGVTDNISRGNVFMVGFFLRELIEAILHED